MKAYTLKNNIFMLNIITKKMEYIKCGSVMYPKYDANKTCIMRNNNNSYRITNDVFKLFFDVI